MQNFSFTISGNHFRSVYSVYVVVIKHKNAEVPYYYVGQTGDSAHLTAQSPFYRMGGHFRNGNATDNQIIRKLAEKVGIEFNKENRYVLEEWLTDCEVNYHIFPVHEYVYANKDLSKDKYHTPYKRDTLVIESIVAKAIISMKKEDLVLNKKTGTSFPETQFHQDKRDEIITYLKAKKAL